MYRRSAKPLPLARIGFYGNFGAGNLGNEATLHVVIGRILKQLPGAKLLCFCTNPQDVSARHNIAAFPSEAIDKKPGLRRPQGHLARLFRIVFLRIPLELIHWVKCLRMVWHLDMLIVAGTGIVADYTTGPLGWPYDIFKLSMLASLCRVKLIFLSIGAGPINHPLSRRLLKTSLALAHQRSYRDEASKLYLQSIGFPAERDLVYPDVVFGLSRAHASAVCSDQRPVVGVGIKDFGSGEPDVHQEYLETMATFVSWLQERGYGVRLLIGDIQYDTPVIDQFIDILRSRNIPTAAPMLIVQPALTIEELQRQVSETAAVISSRFHNLVVALIENKPIITLSDHGKLDSLATDLGLRQYLISLHALRADVLIDTFEKLESDAGRLKPYLEAQLDKYRQELDRLYASFLTGSNTGRGSAEIGLGYNQAPSQSL
jgi:polysaccharide pyruvyl transferase WcaK-like protein